MMACPASRRARPSQLPRDTGRLDQVLRRMAEAASSPPSVVSATARQRYHRDDQRSLQSEPSIGVDLAQVEAIEFATLEWVDWFNDRRLLEPIGNIPPAEAEERYYAMLEQPAMAA